MPIGTPIDIGSRTMHSDYRFREFSPAFKRPLHIPAAYRTRFATAGLRTSPKDQFTAWMNGSG
jgi:hypothetical protein